MSRAALLGIAISLLVHAPAGPARAQLRIGEIVETRISTPNPYPAAVVASGAEVVWRHVLHHPGATFLKLRFSRLDVAGSVRQGNREGDHVVVRSPRGDEEILVGSRRKDFWSRSFPGDTVVVELYADREREGAGIEIDAYGYGSAATASQGRSVCGTDESTDLCDAADPDRIRVADPVARLLFASDCGGIYLCTGFLVSPDGLLMTNAHCANSARESRSLEVWFNYTWPFEEPREPDCSLADRPNPDVYRAEGLVLSDCSLDVAVHRMDVGSQGNPAAIYGYLPLSARAPEAGEALWIPQHPSGRPKRIAEAGVVSSPQAGGIDYCSDPPSCSGEGTATGQPTELAHTVDTGPGSSGAPVLDAANHVIGLHHAGGCDAAGGENAAILMSRILPLLGEAPRARLETSTPRVAGTVPLVVALDGRRSFDPDGGAIARYEFDPGDGSPVVVSAEPTLVHTYEIVGRFRAQLSVVDDEGTRSKRPAVRRVRTRADG